MGQLKKGCLPLPGHLAAADRGHSFTGGKGKLVGMGELGTAGKDGVVLEETLLLSPSALSL